MTTATYHNTWSVELITEADSPLHIAQHHGMEYLGPITGNFHLFRLAGEPLQSDHVTSELLKHPQVLTAEQQTVLSRKKRRGNDKEQTNQKAAMDEL